ncbi:ParA family protein [Ethanoligenens harbinense]|uniref:Uncharacterized protein n=1 Tax=Ethanoligenens harbinense (strain DSM 18485 / JCM 12961 / CGMCC 1.5033 / YUAN-3) TaxID=663278 RepID=E6U787_ETHHY|nr:ParA family protein [Ethanoligenens harbinense]ADU25822.1 hypothetical protein Ethha_0235 [Ethanoligenens harbinense YUAN-3]AVQ94984.1 ParA family protein [Ethanoligenens harbinense YUAN-3]AYF37676.1 ParA family protein [Ethanoligenens harbinense]AYF40396.1 ParA family protein [Ethanoligenens harbinense]QCN91231.1 ParA family protein [Ethanoligenens harbinense]
MLQSRLQIITGHYGSGKTTFAVNLAMENARAGRKTCLVDMDIVNPYFRAADSKGPLEAAGVRVIRPIYAGTNLDLPALPGELAAVFDDTSYTVVLDVGGDDAGAAALGAYAHRILAADYAHLYVFNARRPLTSTPEEAVQILREIEAVSRVPATGLVNNTNLGNETDTDVPAASAAFAEQTAALTGLPLIYTGVRQELADAARSRLPSVYPLTMWVVPPW